MKAQLVLASASPRRAELLELLRLRFVVRPCEVDESTGLGESPLTYVERVARNKVLEGIAGLEQSETGLPVLGADTAVVLDGEIMGKPVDAADNARMLVSLSARTHEVLTAVAVGLGSRLELRVSRSRVRFRTISAEETRAYAAFGEGADKAGGYGLQGVGGVFVDHIEGSYSGIVGLPMAETEALLLAFGVDTWQYRS